jgi:hypothetical protein
MKLRMNGLSFSKENDGGGPWFSLRAPLGRGAARRDTMAKGQKKSNKEIRKPKAEKPKKNASNPSTKGMVSDIKR